MPQCVIPCLYEEKTYLTVTIGTIAVLAMGATYNTVASGSSSDPSALLATATQEVASSWQAVLMKDGKECEGFVFEVRQDAEKAASKIGCSGYHEHHQEDGSVLYMPCSTERPRDKVDAEKIRTEIQDALAKGERPQLQAKEKLAWLAAKNLD